RPHQHAERADQEQPPWERLQRPQEEQQRSAEERHVPGNPDQGMEPLVVAHRLAKVLGILDLLHPFAERCHCCSLRWGLMLEFDASMAIEVDDGTSAMTDVSRVSPAPVPLPTKPGRIRS